LKVRAQLARRRKALLPLAAVVVFATTYALILPAVTLDDNAANDTPGIRVAKTSADDTSASTTVTNDSQSEASGDAKDNGNSGAFGSGDNQKADNNGNASSDSGNANDNGNQSNDNNDSDNSNASDTSSSYQQAQDAVVAARKKQDAMFKQADLAGKRIEGTPVKKYDVSEWQNGTHNFLTDAQSYTPDGYVAFPKGDSPANVNTLENPRRRYPAGIRPQQLRRIYGQHQGRQGLSCRGDG
jgi:hypothetical protein